VAPSPSAARHNVLGQLSQDSTDDRFPICVYNDQTFKNFTAAMPFKIVAGATEQMAGLVFRYQNVSNFYVVRISAIGRNLRFYKVVDGKYADPATPIAIAITPGVWHTLIVQCEGNRVTCRLDNTSMAPIQTPTTFDAGKIGYWTKSDAVTYFGGLTIDYTPATTAAQTLVRDILKQYPRIAGLRIYMADDNGALNVVASKNESELNQAGADAEKACYEKGDVFYGHGKGTVDVDMPLNDRNGEPVAVVRVQLKSNSLAETQEMVLNRVRIIINEMQKHVLSKADLL
ncbi:MAG TPA: LamG domain-containing protein, partial [Desulfuromonadaceae bacterium]|nr:LamG domain-containing protein [Desulfuromonadaceae bacterium]